MVQELFTFLEIIKDPNHFGSYGLYLSVYVRNKNGGVRKILIHFKITINRLRVNINETISFLKKSTIFFPKQTTNVVRRVALFYLFATLEYLA